MPKINRALKEIPLEKLVVSENQARQRNTNVDIDELVENIRVHGLLEPIVVCLIPGDPEGRFEVIMGQRRLLAHQRLGRDAILAMIIEGPVDEVTSKVLSYSENLLRTGLEERDATDVCTALYRKYGSAKAVAEELGLPYQQVRRHVKYERLTPVLRKAVDDHEVPLEGALKAQDIADMNIASNGKRSEGEVEREGKERDVLALAQVLASCTGTEQHRILDTARRHPEMSLEDLARQAASPEARKGIVVTMTLTEHAKLRAYAKSQGLTQDKAAAHLLAAGLADVGTS